MIDNDKLLTLPEARNLPLWPKRHRRETLWRYCTRGVLIGPSRIRLQFARSGQTYYTTARWVAEFLEAQIEATRQLHALPTLTRHPFVSREVAKNHYRKGARTCSR